jgi:hypothetical protein
MNSCKEGGEDPHFLIEDGSAKVKDRENDEASKQEGNQDTSQFIVLDHGVGHDNQKRVKGRCLPSCPIARKYLFGMTNVFGAIIVDDFWVDDEENTKAKSEDKD